MVVIVGVVVVVVVLMVMLMIFVVAVTMIMVVVHLRTLRVTLRSRVMRRNASPIGVKRGTMVERFTLQ